ncbi:TadE/TadG family type IV pilus assembly protein [Sphingomonas aerophila]|uniref:Flp pilus assembly protein TadG n=1 Tax=Sphingomonas aerophila TaxID=1344948 RepID=A0A7W9EVM5_9SPHN|nr:TadE family protein [Sphingomonas aerophila]MBB5714877.1 Flp pilus assembly protein TadG [Sphingomonas aerophila]
MRRVVARLRGDRRGVTILEFAIVCPVLLILLMGLADICFQAYLQAVLTGAVQKAARDSALEGNGTETATTAIDDKVKGAVNGIIKTLVWDKASRQSFAHFADIGGEYYWDMNKNNSYDAGECFVDTNGNSRWDADPSTAGQGSANAVVIYRMGFNYPRLFPVAKLIGWSDTVHLTSQTVLKNQPYKFQNTADNVKVCPKL